MALVNYLCTWVNSEPGVGFKIIDLDPLPAVVLAVVPPGTFTAVVALESNAHHTLAVYPMNAAGDGAKSANVMVSAAVPQQAPTGFTVVKVV